MFRVSHDDVHQDVSSFDSVNQKGIDCIEAENFNQLAVFCYNFLFMRTIFNFGLHFWVHFSYKIKQLTNERMCVFKLPEPQCISIPKLSFFSLLGCNPFLSDIVSHQWYTIYTIKLHLIADSR